MRTSILAAVAAGAAIGLAGCTSASSGDAVAAGASASTSPSAAGSAESGTGGGIAGSCVVGTWKSTGANGSFESGTAKGTLTGGSGLLLTVARDGATRIDFASMQPVTFDSSINGTSIEGRFSYGGTATGAVKVDDPAATSGTWEPVGTSDWRNMTITVEVVKPVQSTIFDHAKIADFTTSANDQTGGSVDVQPILEKASYSCSGSTLTLGPPPGRTVGGTWTLTRA